MQSDSSTNHSLIPYLSKDTHAKLQTLFESREHSVATDIIVSSLSVLFIIALKYFLSPYIAFASSPFLLCFIPIIFSSWFGGLRPGTIATVLSAIVVKFYFMNATASFFSQILQLSIFLVQGYVLSYVCESLHRMHRELQSYSKRLYETDLKYKMVIENTNDLISMSDVSGNLLFISPSVEKILGYKPSELMDKTARSAIHPDDINLLQEKNLKVMQGEPSFVANFRVRHKDGRWIMLEGNGSAIFENSKPKAILSTCRNITERAQAEQQIKEHLSLLHTVIEGISDAVFVKDLMGKYILVNSAGADYLGKPAEEVISKHATDFFPIETVEQINKSEEEALNTEGTVNYDETISTPDGDKKTYLSTKSIYRDAQGNIIGFVGISHDITERKKYEDELSKYAEIIETSDDGIYSKDINGIIQSWNQAAEEIYGYTASEIIGKSVTLLFPKSKKNEFAQIMEQLSNGIKITHYETERIRKDGRIINVSVTISPLKNSKGKIIGASSIDRDITAQKELEKNLERSSQRIENILNSITDAFFSLDNYGKLIYLNKQAQDILKVKGETIIGKSVWDEFPEIIDSQFHKKYFRVIATNEAVKFEKFSKKLNKCFEVHAYPSADGMSVYLTDITDRKEAEAALRENEERFRILAESVPQIIWTADRKGDIDYYNQRWYSYTGLPNDTVTPMAWQNTIHTGDIDNVLKKWNLSLKTGKPFEVEYRLKRKDGKNRWHLGRAVPIKNRQGEIIKWFGTGTDIDEQKKMDERKDEFISTASHELKTPITTIKAFTQLLQKRFDDNTHPEVSLYLYKMDYQINRLKTLINDMLDVSKIQAGKMEFFDKEFDMNDLLLETVEDMQSATTTHKISIKGLTNKTLYGDRYRIGQVLNNLLSNAIKYSPDANKIVVHVTDDAKKVTIGVQDFGIGIAPEDLNKIFDRFYRINGNTASRYEGMGLGLHIVGEIIKRHDGKIWVDSTEGKGSTFYVSFPIYKVAKTNLRSYELDKQHHAKARISN